MVFYQVRRDSVHVPSYIVTLLKQAHRIAHTQRYILNSFIKTGFCCGTACHERADDANARLLSEKGLLLLAARRACIVLRGKVRAESVRVGRLNQSARL